MSQSEQQLQNLWKLREYISETISHWTPYKNDISVTVSRVPAFLKDIDAIVEANYPDFEVVWFGHIGDGNLHLNILKPETSARTSSSPGARPSTSGCSRPSRSTTARFPPSMAWA